LIAAKDNRGSSFVSVLFGIWNIDGRPIDSDYLAKVKSLLTPYAPDGDYRYMKDNICILYHSFHTTRESHRENQPHVSSSGAVITWDGCLDNRSELIRDLRSSLPVCPTDVEIVAAAFELWGRDCFARLIGDWALAIWNANTRSLLLAKDVIGTRHLYYSADRTRIAWSTILEPLVLFGGTAVVLCEEYIAGWLSSFPATHITPYVGIRSVSPSSFVRLGSEKHATRKYWDFDPSKTIRYRTDGEYEEHFRTVFSEAVRRRLRSDRPVMAELSGGMDSSSIVCVADTVLASSVTETPRLDTVSYYDDGEPNWNERPYFRKVEEKRGRLGCHIDVGSYRSTKIEFVSDRFVPTPGGSGSHNDAARELAACMSRQGNRVLLSGIGGDEITGGVPTPIPELEDLLITVRFGRLAHQLKAWALVLRKPWPHLLFEAGRRFLPDRAFGPALVLPACLDRAFVRRNRRVFRGYERGLQPFGPPPTFQENMITLEMLRRQRACCVLCSEPPHVKRYPYLDRDFLEFIYAIPREQLVRPGYRRSLMRRALAGLVPDEILDRKRKAYLTRAPLAVLSKLPTTSKGLAKTTQRMILESLGFLDYHKLNDELLRIRSGDTAHSRTIMRALAMEFWLRHLRDLNLLECPLWTIPLCKAGHGGVPTIVSQP
jgi:asparagine synthase (glutamine-hydrolysing)